MDTTTLREAGDTLLETATAVAVQDPAPTPPDGEWNPAQVLAHVVAVNAATISAVAAVTSGALTTYDNRMSQDASTLAQIIETTGGHDGLRARIRAQIDALCALVEATGQAEWETQLPARLISNDVVLVDQPLSLRDIVSGLANAELPGHTSQLGAMLP